MPLNYCHAALKVKNTISCNMQGYYINLDEREDRRSYFEQYIQKQYSFFGGIERFSAVKHSIGAIGCATSHYTTIEKALENENIDIICILEDDLNIINPVYFNNFLSDFENIKSVHDWDVIVLTPSGNTVPGSDKMISHNFNKIVNTQTATGYIMKRDFAKVLAKTIKEGCETMLRGGDPHYYTNDQCWKPLQLTHNFYYYKHLFATQLPCYSSIEKCYVDYTPQLMKQQYK
jgi:glycosyl transferase family 25